MSFARRAWGGLAREEEGRLTCAGLVVEDKKALLGLARLWGVAGENARDGRVAPEKSGVAGEVDVCVDVDEEVPNTRSFLRNGKALASVCCEENKTEPESATEEDEAEQGSRRRAVEVRGQQ